MTNQKNKKEANTHIFFGDDESRRSESLKRLLDRICPKEERALGLEIVDGECSNADAAVNAVKQCIEALQTVGFLGKGKTVWLRNSNFMDSSNVAKASAVKDMLKSLAKLITGGIGGDCSLIISADKIFKGSAFYRESAKCADVLEFKLALKASQRNEVSRDLALAMFAERGVRISRRVVDNFISRCGSDGRVVGQEVEKLCLYVGDQREVTSEDIAMLTTPASESEFWELGDAVAKRDKRRALRLVRQEREKGGNPIGMIIGIEKTILQLLTVRECLRNGLLSIINNNGQWDSDNELLDGVFAGGMQDLRKTHSYRVGMLAKDSKRYTRTELRNGLKLAIASHEKMVSSSISGFTVLELLLQDLTR